MRCYGAVRFPLAASLLEHYCAGSADTLRFDAAPLMRDAAVQSALRANKRGIVFKKQPAQNPDYYVVGKTNLAFYYAFDLLRIKMCRKGVAFYDDYYFQPLAGNVRPLFQFGKIKVRLNDGLIKVAYPDAKPFVAYGEARRPR